MFGSSKGFRRFLWLVLPVLEVVGPDSEIIFFMSVSACLVFVDTTAFERLSSFSESLDETLLLVVIREPMIMGGSLAFLDEEMSSESDDDDEDDDDDDELEEELDEDELEEELDDDELAEELDDVDELDRAVALSSLT